MISYADLDSLWSCGGDWGSWRDLTHFWHHYARSFDPSTVLRSPSELAIGCCARFQKKRASATVSDSSHIFVPPDTYS